VIDLERQIRTTHPEVSALFIKPQSVQAAAEQPGQVDAIFTPDPSPLADG